jgi:hypothetical protein
MVLEWRIQSVWLNLAGFMDHARKVDSEESFVPTRNLVSVSLAERMLLRRPSAF